MIEYKYKTYQEAMEPDDTTEFEKILDAVKENEETIEVKGYDTSWGDEFGTVKASDEEIIHEEFQFKLVIEDYQGVDKERADEAFVNSIVICYDTDIYQPSFHHEGDDVYSIRWESA